MSEKLYGESKSNSIVTWLALVLIGLGSYLFLSTDKKTVTNSVDRPKLVVYCAAGLRLPLEAAQKVFLDEYGVEIQLEHASSGELEGKLKLDADNGHKRADLYIPADTFFADRARNKQLSQEMIPLAKFRLVLAVNPDLQIKIKSVDDLIAAKIPYAICNKEAGVGKKTAAILAESNKYEVVNQHKKVSFPTVTEQCNAIRSSEGVQAGFVWDTTAKQFGLKIIELEELKEAESTVSVNVVSSTAQATLALKFARFISSPEYGNKYFEKYGFTSIKGDKWAEEPNLVMYCGGVNRLAIMKTIEDFEMREGVTIDTQFAGCGTLVNGIKSLESKNRAFPDVFMTCDKSFYDKVDRHFSDQPLDISSTRVILLVRKGNPKGIHSIKDLTQAGLSIGTTDPQMSTLGTLSWDLFKEQGLTEKIRPSVVVTAPTAHELIGQFLAHDKLDCVLVYEANCQNVSDKAELIPIKSSIAKAVQNIGASKTTDYALIMERLIETLRSDQSKQRFLSTGFQIIKN